MEIRIAGGSSNEGGIRPAFEEVAKKIGLAKEELEDIGKAFEKDSVRKPSGLRKLLHEFDRYDGNNDGILNHEELLTYTGDKEFDLSQGPFGLITEDKGYTVDQLQIFMELAEDRDLDTDNIESLIKKFSEYDKDEDGRLNETEFTDYAKDEKINALEAGDREMTTVVFENAIIAYTQNKETSLGFAGGTLLRNA